MSIKKESNGTYTLCYSKKDNITLKIVRTKKRGFKTQKEAKEYERSLSRESSSVTFYSLFLECNDNTEQEKDTYNGKIGIINNYMPSLKTIKYEELTKPYLTTLRHEIAKLDLSPKTKNKILDVVKLTCKYANEVYDLPNNTKVIKRFKQTKKEFDIWTPKEYFKFEKCLSPKYEDCVPFFRAIFFTGMRKGEARALTIDDYDAEKGIIYINKSMRKYKNSLKAPKTPNSKRKIILDKYTNKMLKPLKCHEKWLFGDFKPMSRDRVDNAFKYGIENSGVKKIRIHDLRHSHASYLISQGANIVAVSKRLGHANINMTLSTYAHVMKDSEDKLINILNNSNM